MTYELLKFLHVAAVVVWVGGVVTLSLLQVRLAGEGDGPAVAALGRHATVLGRIVLGPAAVLVLLSGVGMMLLGSPVGPWMLWGFVALFGSIALGAVPIRRATADLARVATSGGTSRGVMEGPRRRLALWSVANVVLLLSAVLAMVVKPAL